MAKLDIPVFTIGDRVRITEASSDSIQESEDCHLDFKNFTLAILGKLCTIVAYSDEEGEATYVVKDERGLSSVAGYFGSELIREKQNQQWDN